MPSNKRLACCISMQVGGRKGAGGGVEGDGRMDGRLSDNDRNPNLCAIHWTAAGLTIVCSLGICAVGKNRNGGQRWGRGKVSGAALPFLCSLVQDRPETLRRSGGVEVTPAPPSGRPGHHRGLLSARGRRLKTPPKTQALQSCGQQQTIMAHPAHPDAWERLFSAHQSLQLNYFYHVEKSCSNRLLNIKPSPLAPHI